MYIWITGSAGFLGSRLCEKFSSLGHEVLGLSRRTSSGNWRSVSVDLASERAGARLKGLRQEAGTPEVVIHTASRQPSSASLPEYVKSNLLTTANLLEFFGKTPPRQIIYTSTLSVYSLPAENPVSEKHAAGNTSAYAITKRASEKLLQSFSDHCQAIILRLPSLYGKGQADSFVDGLARTALRGEPIELFSAGELVRDALHVKDVVDAVELFVRLSPAGRMHYVNLGCGRRTTSAEYARALVEALESQSPILPVNKPSRAFDLYANISEAQRLVGWSPPALRESMAEYAYELQA
jgi:nucleoside-diphosphate-sugar epimerase